MTKKNRKKKVKEPRNESAQRSSPRPGRARALAGWQHELFGLTCLVAAVITALALGSYSPTDPVFAAPAGRASNLVGLVGAYLADGLLFCLGVSAFLLVVGLLYAAAVAFTHGALRVTARKAIGYLSLLILGTGLFQILFTGDHLLGHAPGGVLGEVVGGLFVSLLSVTGSIVVLVAGMGMGLIAATGLSLVVAARLLGRGCLAAGRAAARAGGWIFGHLGRAVLAIARTTGAWLAVQATEFFKALRQPKQRVQPATVPPAPSFGSFEFETQVEEDPRGNHADGALLASDLLVGFLHPPVSCPEPIGRREPVVVISDPPLIESCGPTSLDESEPVSAPPITEPPIAEPPIERRPQPEIVLPRPQDHAAEEPDPARIEEDRRVPTFDWHNFELPSLDFLDNAEQKEQQEQEIDEAQLHAYAQLLERKLSDYGISGQVTKIMPGPVVTMYEYAPGPGIKVARIAGLSQDLALALEAISVRIIAPIPGRAVVGIEVSNKIRQTVYAKEIIGNKIFSKSRSKLTMALGKNIEGAPYVADLNKMPHLLVAGATGTGKSVALNCIITSILYKATPEDVRFIMVDPKVLELSLYEGIPHLLLPVVTDPRKAQAALQWAVNEMDRRIQLLHGAGVRNLDSFNKKAEKQAQALAERYPTDPQAFGPTPARKKKILVIDKTAASEDLEQVAIEVDAASEYLAPGALADEPLDLDAPRLTKMPHIIIVIDELADLMMTSGREVETNIARIAQKARAAGIHLIVATQRPSVNVITGLIKANLPARISFRVASKVDSRTILDSNGADSLLGNGDMLFHPPTSSQLVRVHGAFISEEEITKVVEHLKAQAEPIYDETILAAAEQDEEEGAEDEGGDGYKDELYDVAVQIVAEMGQASTSMVQRKLRIGYNRAARLIERMECEGIVGPPDGSRPRQVLIQNHVP